VHKFTTKRVIHNLYKLTTATVVDKMTSVSPNVGLTAAVTIVF